MTLARCGGVAIAAMALLIGVDCGLADQYTIGPDDVLDVAVWNNTAVVTKKLSNYMSAPEVSVIVREIHSITVSVMGEVRKSGRYELRTRTTVLDAIAVAGGFTDFASPSRVAVLRQEGKTVTRILFNYGKGVAADAKQENFFLRAGDIVVVP